METFIEAVEKDKGVQVEWRAEIATCNKDFQSGFVSCGTKVLNLTAIDTPPLLGCNPQELANLQPLDPVEMNTVTSIGTNNIEYVKTVKVEKEILRCPTANGPQIGEDYLFTEIIEQRVNIPGTHTITYRPSLRQFFGVFCRKDELKGTIANCRRYIPKPLAG